MEFDREEHGEGVELTSTKNGSVNGSIRRRGARWGRRRFSVCCEREQKRKRERNEERGGGSSSGSHQKQPRRGGKAWEIVGAGLRQLWLCR